MTTLRVVRPNDSAGRLRNLVVEVDGERVGGLRPKQQLEVEISADPHRVVGRMDWVRSRELLVEPTAATDLAVVQLSLPFSAIFDIFFRPRRAIRSRRLQ